MGLRATLWGICTLVAVSLVSKASSAQLAPILDAPVLDLHEIFDSDLQNGWQQSVGVPEYPSQIPSYFQDDTFVYLQGAIKGTDDSEIFTLPPGFRPKNTVALLASTDPLNEIDYNLTHASPTGLGTRWLFPEEGQPLIGTNHGDQFSLLACKKLCTNQINCKGFYLGESLDRKEVDVCITLSRLIPVAANSVQGRSFTRVLDTTEAVKIEIDNQGRVSVTNIQFEASISFRGRFAYVRTTTCSDTGTFDSTGDMVYNLYDVDRPLHYHCRDVETGEGKYHDMKLANGVLNRPGYFTAQYYEEVETGYVHFRGVVDLPCCSRPIMRNNQVVACAEEMCLLATDVPVPDWQGFVSSVRVPQLSDSAVDGVNFGRYLEIFPNGSIFVSSGTQTEVYLDSIVLIATDGDELAVLIAEVFWSSDATQSPVRVLRDYHGVVCLSGGLSFSGFELDNQVIFRLSDPFLPVYRSKHPIACEFALTHPNSQGARRCAVYVEPSGEVRIRIEERFVTGDEAQGIHWISLDGICFSGANVHKQVTFRGTAAIELTGTSFITLP